MKRLIMIMCLALCLIGCGRKSEELSVTTPSGKDISLYMPREEVEKIIGEPTESSKLGTLMYGDSDDDLLEIGYTDGLLSLIRIKSDKLKVGEYSLGGNAENFDGIIYESEKYDYYIKVYDSQKNIVPLTQDELAALEGDYREYGRLDITATKDGTITDILISDKNISMTMKLDK